MHSERTLKLVLDAISATHANTAYGDTRALDQHHATTLNRFRSRSEICDRDTHEKGAGRLSYRSRLMKSSRERLFSRLFETDEYVTHERWPAYVDRWLDACIASHARITGCAPDALHTARVDSSELIFRYKVAPHMDMRMHGG